MDDGGDTSDSGQRRPQPPRRQRRRNDCGLRSAVTKLLDAAEARFGAELQLPEDFCWHVPLVDATQIYDDPKYDMGSVVDDTDSVRESLARDASEYVSIWHEADMSQAFFGLSSVSTSHQIRDVAFTSAGRGMSMHPDSGCVAVS